MNKTCCGLVCFLICLVALRSHTYTFWCWLAQNHSLLSPLEKNVGKLQHLPNTLERLWLCLSQPPTNLLWSPYAKSLSCTTVYFLAHSIDLVCMVVTHIPSLSASSIPLCSLSVRSMVSLDKLKQAGPLKPYQLSVHLCRHGQMGPKSTFSY